uniref:Uncharacterized protein n=1 Tax=Clytia hemisphaerica TaxID=252671 RepID=A0A7M5WY54_9CNID
MGFQYPLTFLSEAEHIQHVKEHQKFYNNILNKINLEIQEQLRNERLAKEKAHQKLLREKKENEQKLQTKNEELQKAQKETEKLQDEARENRETVKQAEQLIYKTEQYKHVESSAKGKTFEEEIKYALVQTKRMLNFDCVIDTQNKMRSCDVRIRVPELGIVGIEAKDKQMITKDDISKFNRDRLQNGFVGSIFWSKSAKIYDTNDMSDLQSFIWMDASSKCLYIRANNDFERIALVIFAYVEFLIALKEGSGSDNKALTETIIKVFDMMVNQYDQFGRLKKEVQNLDITFKKNLEMVTHLCKTHRVKINERLLKETDFVVVYKRDARNLNAYRNDELYKIQSKSFFNPKGKAMKSPMKSPLKRENESNRIDVKTEEPPLSKRSKEILFESSVSDFTAVQEKGLAGAKTQLYNHDSLLKVDPSSFYEENFDSSNANRATKKSILEPFQIDLTSNNSEDTFDTASYDSQEF